MPTHTPTVMLVHGAWADEASWNKTLAVLHSNSVKTVTVGLPMTSLDGDVAALDAALDTLPGTAVLVGHAYAGAVIGATRSTKVKALVYVAGLAPDEGETVAEVFNRFGHDEPTPALAPSADGRIWLPADAFETAFAQDASPTEQKALAAAQRPISPACITVPATAPLWKHVPAWYLLAERDHMIPARTQRFVAERMRAHVHAYPVDHVPQVTAPALVAHVVGEALAGIGS